MVKPSESLSWYRATARPHSTYPKLEGDSTADVCIIGAGYTGLSAALELAEAGQRVIVLEAERVGYGGSGRNGGHIGTGFSPGQDAVAAQVGREDARKCFQLTQEAKVLIEHRIKNSRHRMRPQMGLSPLRDEAKQAPGPAGTAGGMGE